MCVLLLEQCPHQDQKYGAKDFLTTGTIRDIAVLSACDTWCRGSADTCDT